MNARAATRTRTGDLQIFGLTLSQLSYRGLATRSRVKAAQRLATIAWPAGHAQNGYLRIADGHAETRDRTGDLQIFGLTLSQLSYRGLMTSTRVEIYPHCGSGCDDLGLRG